MSQEVIERFSTIANGFDARVQAAPAGSWSNASPCDDWTATDVVMHIVGNMNGMSANLTGGEPVVADAADPVGAWNAAKAQLMGILATADLGQTVNGPFGPQPAEQFIGRLMCTDTLVHTWDLARAVGGDEQLDAASVTAAYSGLKPMDAMIRMPGVFGPKIESAEGADEQTEFIQFLGRKV